jgi:hypothetical protein
MSTETKTETGREFVAHNRPVFDDLHPRIYAAAAGLVAWFAISAWVLFDRGGTTSLPLAFVTLLFVVAVGLPWVMSVAWRKSQPPSQQDVQGPSFHEWKSGDLSVWGAKLRNSHAAIDALLPLMAVAFGLTAIGIVFAIERALT